MNSIHTKQAFFIAARLGPYQRLNNLSRVMQGYLKRFMFENLKELLPFTEDILESLTGTSSFIVT